MKIHPHLATAFIALLAFNPAANAAHITGSINFSSGSDGGVNIQDTGGSQINSLALAAGVQSWLFPQVDTTTGSFGSTANGTAVTLAQQWVFNSPASATPLWTIAGPDNFSFNLTSAVVFQGQYHLAIKGTGTLTGTNFDPTPAVWRFTTQGVDVNGVYSWSSTTTASSVPDSGTSIVLLGSSLLGLCSLRRKLF